MIFLAASRVANAGSKSSAFFFYVLVLVFTSSSSFCSSCCSSSSGEDKTFRTWLLDTFVLVLMEVVYGNCVSYFQTKLIKKKELIGNEPSCFFWLKLI